MDLLPWDSALSEYPNRRPVAQNYFQASKDQCLQRLGQVLEWAFEKTIPLAPPVMPGIQQLWWILGNTQLEI